MGDPPRARLRVGTTVVHVRVLAAAFLCSIISAVAANNNNTAIGTTTVSPAAITTDTLKRMKSATWLNQDQVLLSLNFTTTSQADSPYPSSSYDVTIAPHTNCYVVFRDPQRTTYDMITASEPPTTSNSLERSYGVFLSHTTPCGVCSNLQDLAVYLETPDLTNPVRLCGFTSFVSDRITVDCLKDAIGFSDTCATIWFHNTQHTRSKCLWPCLLHLFSPNNMPVGFVDPCRPDNDNNDDNNACSNTINQGPACADFQYEFGNEYRLNSCLQCDECHSGPLFQKIAGRTRRTSGIESGIDRPDIPTIPHDYFTMMDTDTLP